jgi:hypothetical protein
MSTVVARPQTNWKFILVTSGAALVLGIVFLKGFWLPYQENLKKLRSLEEDYDNQRRDFLVFQKEKQRLERDRLLGLPRNLNQAEREYIDYLQRLLDKCGFDAHPDVQQTGVDFRGGLTTAGKKAGHMAVTYLVRAQGPWTSIVKFLEKFQRTPLLHRLKTWTVDASGAGKSAASKLTLNVTVEALVVNRNEQRPDNLWGIDPRLVAVDAMLGLNRMPAGWATLLRAQALLLPELPRRSYVEVPRLNPFVGGIPISEVDLAAQALRDKEKEKDRQAKASLVFTSEPERALLVVPGDTDKKTEIALKRDGTFPVWEGKEAKVLRICHRKVYFRFENKLYGIEIGEKMKEALGRPLSVSEGRALGLPGI